MRSIDLTRAVEICKEFHPLLEAVGYYCALTGGCLYREGERKDVDIVIYRHRQRKGHVNMVKVMDALSPLGVEVVQYFGFVTKATYKGYSIDFFDPEEFGTYVEGQVGGDE